MDDDLDEQLRDAARRLRDVIDDCVESGMTSSEISDALGISEDDTDRLLLLDVSD